MAPLLPPSFLEALMLPQPATVPQPAAADIRPIGVGIDTSRYGHYAAFLRHDLQPAADELQFVESAAGYAQFRATLASSIVSTARQRPLRTCGSMPPGSTPTICSTSCTRSRHRLRHFTHLLRRSATQQELSRRPLRQPEVRSRRGPRRRTLRSQRTTTHPSRSCPTSCARSARSPVACKPSCANARGSSISSTICSR